MKKNGKLIAIILVVMVIAGFVMNRNVFAKNEEVKEEPKQIEKVEIVEERNVVTRKGETIRDHITETSNDLEAAFYDVEMQDCIYNPEEDVFTVIWNVDGFVMTETVEIRW